MTLKHFFSPTCFGPIRRILKKKNYWGKNSSILPLKDIDCPIAPLPNPFTPLDNAKTPLKNFSLPKEVKKEKLHLIHVLENQMKCMGKGFLLFNDLELPTLLQKRI